MNKLNVKYSAYAKCILNAESEIIPGYLFT